MRRISTYDLVERLEIVTPSAMPATWPLQGLMPADGFGRSATRSSRLTARHASPC